MSILLKKCLNSNNVPNMILYGISNINKQNILYETFKNI